MISKMMWHFQNQVQNAMYADNEKFQMNSLPVKEMCINNYDQIVYKFILFAKK